MRRTRWLALGLCLLLGLAGCAAPHTQIPLQTPMPTLSPTPEPTPTPTPAQQLGNDTLAQAPSYSTYALPLDLRSGESFSTALYKLVMDAAAAGEKEVSLEGVNATAAQVDSVRAFVLARGQSAFLSDISLEENALALVYTSEDTTEIQQAAQDFDKAAQSILEECYQTGYTQLQCAMALYQYLGQHVEYSYESMDDGLYGAIVDKKAMANGYANAYAFLLDQFGIENALVSAPDKSHVWNLITIDGVSYHVDVTFGANLLKGQSLKFFGMNDAAAATALGYTGWTVSNGVADLETPLCSSTRFEALQKAGRSDMDYAGNAVYMDAYEEAPGVSKLDLLTGEVSVVFSEQTDGIAVLDGLLYYLRNEDGYLYTLNLTTNETVQLFEGTKVTALERRGNVIYYSAEGQSEMGQISP